MLTKAMSEVRRVAGVGKESKGETGSNGPGLGGREVMVVGQFHPFRRLSLPRNSTFSLQISFLFLPHPVPQKRKLMLKKGTLTLEELSEGKRNSSNTSSDKNSISTISE
jgi:hypothetical protein